MKSWIVTDFRRCLTAVLFGILFLSVYGLAGQDKGLVNTSESPYAKLQSPDMQDVCWVGGFWGERFEVCRDSMVPTIWDVYHDPNVSHAFKNFQIAAGLAEGNSRGPSFHDGDFYKVLESAASVYALSRDPKLDAMMDEAIAVIAKVQREDGYIYTKAAIKQKQTGQKVQFAESQSFEIYNMGHLMTAGCVHYRATGKTSLLAVARKAADYLYGLSKENSPVLAHFAICPSHYMGAIEMYRTTHDPKYLELAKYLIDVKGTIDDGTDDNQDRLPVRKHTEIMGHAVRANYLYAGVADVYAETGDKSLLSTLSLVWDDLTRHKMYITGGCGALYDGVSPDGTSTKPSEIQKIHQAYGRAYQLPNLTAHCETCANIGNVLWNWRMLEITGDAKYADVLELALYNSVLSGISLDGKRFLYTNPLSCFDEIPYKLRWSFERVPYISRSNCCPPNVVRTIAQVSNYAYSISDEGLWVNLYGANELSTRLKDGSALKLSQQTEYPWDGLITLTMKDCPSRPFSVFFRIPQWATGAAILVNEKTFEGTMAAGSYAEVSRLWKTGDKVDLKLPMEIRLMEANPLVEETRNQTAVMRGPVVYCLELKDLPAGVKIFDAAIPADAVFTPKAETIENSNVVTLEGQGVLTGRSHWDNVLYREISKTPQTPVKLKLIPYYAWGNRGQTDMEVWIPLNR